jgi:3-deoxy-D-manno-octulosonic-acid transferase
MAGLVGWPFFYWHLRSRGGGESFAPRLGLRLPAGPPPGEPRIWLHGVSVGEILAALPLARELKTLLPAAALMVSTGTETGQRLARKYFSPLGALVCYFPLDIPWTVRRYLDNLRPQLAVTLESEIWPNFLSLARQRRVLLALANARLSDKTFRRYLRYKRYITDIINSYDIVAASDSQDYQRLLEVGMEPGRLRLTGNLKCDRLLQERREDQARQFRLLLHRGGAESDRAPVFLAASTHPGEEEAVLKAYEELRGPYPALLLVLAPRHPQRAPEVAQLLKKHGLSFNLFSRLKENREVRSHPAVLVDTIGDLFSLYGTADLAFVGGSLVAHGGQNFLEAAAWGLAPIYGPHISNFLWAKAILAEAGGGIEVADAASLAAAAANLLAHPERRRELGDRARAALALHQGAARRQAELIAELWRKQGK